jgi:hypothetical protein
MALRRLAPEVFAALLAAAEAAVVEMPRVSDKIGDAYH